MNKLMIGLFLLGSVSVFAADPCAATVDKAARALADVNASLNGTTTKFKPARKTKQSLPSKSAYSSYRVDVKTSDGQEYFYLVQTRSTVEKCFVETVAYWYND